MGFEDDDVDSAPSARIWGFWKKITIAMPDAEAREVLRKHDGLVRMVMRSYRIPDDHFGFGIDDLYAVGQIVLLQAHSSYDETKGEFSTWAVRLLRQSFLDVVRRTRGQTRTQQADYIALREWRRWMHAVMHVGEEAAGPEPELPSSRRVRAVEAALRRRMILTGVESEDGRVAEDDPHEAVARNQTLTWLRERVDSNLLTPSEQRVIQGVLGDMRQQEIADAMGLTRQRVQQIYAKAVEKLQAAARREKVLR